jgi:hypothetical protein
MRGFPQRVALTAVGALPLAARQRWRVGRPLSPGVRGALCAWRLSGTPADLAGFAGRTIAFGDPSLWAFAEATRNPQNGPVTDDRRRSSVPRGLGHPNFPASACATRDRELTTNPRNGPPTDDRRRSSVPCPGLGHPNFPASACATRDREATTNPRNGPVTDDRRRSSVPRGLGHPNFPASACASKDREATTNPQNGPVTDDRRRSSVPRGLGHPNFPASACATRPASSR